jgi:hypothetical protein
VQTMPVKDHPYYSDYTIGSSQSFSTLPAAGNSIIVPIYAYNVSYSGVAMANGNVTDNQGNTYTKIAESSSGGNNKTYVFAAYNIGTPSGTFTISVTQTAFAANGEVWGALEVSGLAISSVVDQLVDGPPASCTAADTITSGATTQADELAIGITGLAYDPTLTFTTDAGWTESYRKFDTSNYGGFSVVSKILSATGTVSHTWNNTTPARYYCPRALVTFKGAGAPPCGAVLFNDSGSIGVDSLYYNKTSDSVGVGTTKSAPAAKLDISGSLRVANDATTCSGTINGAIRFNTGTNKLNFCDGTSWVVLNEPVTGATSTTPSSTGYFVLTNSTFNGNRSGLAGANANCYTDLNTNNWKDKATATSNGWVNAAHISAFLCNGYICQNPMPSTTYSFQRSAQTGFGGATFTSNSTGQAPNNSTAWSGATYFGATGLTYWTGRNGGSSTLWSTSSSNNDCAQWSSSSSGNSGTTGRSTDTNEARWQQASPTTCNNTRRLICMVHPAP